MITRKFDYLIALAKEGHFGRAAEACHISQPTLSVGLRQLEAELGVTILKPGPRYSGLTKRGERVLAFANRMAVECEYLRRDLVTHRGEAEGTLRLGVIASALPLLSTLTAAFQKQFPHVAVKILHLTPAEIQSAFETFKLDVVITYLDEPLKRQSRSQLLYLEEYALLAPSDAPNLPHQPSWRDVSKHPLCVLSPEMLHVNSPVRHLIAGLGRGVSFIETNSVSSLYSHVRSGRWMSVVPRSLADLSQTGGDLIAFPLPPDENHVVVGIMIPDQAMTTPLGEEFFKVAACCLKSATTVS